MRVAAVVAAAGEGRRMSERWRHSPFAGVISTPVAKQFLPLAGKPLVCHALEVLQRCEAVDFVALVVGEGDVAFAQAEVVARFALGKVRAVVPGGPSRQRSVHRGLERLALEGGGWDYVVVHDGVRPLVSEELVLAALEAAQRYGAATVGIPAQDTIKLVDPRGMVAATPDRRRLWAVQTPQAFRFSLLLEAHRRAADAGIEATDDCALVESMGEPVRVVMGSPSNLKVTTPEDLVVAEALLRARSPGDGPFHHNGH